MVILKIRVGSSKCSDIIKQFSVELVFSRFRDILLVRLIAVYGGNNMAVSYKKLFHMMIEQNMSNAQLVEQTGFSANIITRMKRDSYISLESIERICKAM